MPWCGSVFAWAQVGQIFVALNILLQYQMNIKEILKVLKIC
jgi:hypothetical protein